MAKVLKCNDLNPGCSFEARGNTDENVLKKAAEHAKTAHKMKDSPGHSGQGSQRHPRRRQSTRTKGGQVEATIALPRVVPYPAPCPRYSNYRIEKAAPRQPSCFSAIPARGTGTLGEPIYAGDNR
jgi:predicted small metal-binding protein